MYRKLIFYLYPWIFSMSFNRDPVQYLMKPYNFLYYLPVPLFLFY